MLLLGVVLTPATGCLQNEEPSFNELIQQGPSVLAYYFGEHSPISQQSDPYISSLYRPGDLLYQPILDFQNGRLDKAVPKLKSLSEGGNADAMFWYADFLTKSSVKTKHEGYLWFEKAAKLGNPYAAMVLVPTSKICKDYFKELCSIHWQDTAKSLLEKRAAGGDLRAKYYLERPINPHTKADFEKMLALVDESAKMNFFIPTLDMLKFYEGMGDSTDSEIVRILQIVAKYNFLPAYIALNEFSTKNEIYPTAIKLGSKVQLEIDALRCTKESHKLAIQDLIDCLSKAYTLNDFYNEPFTLKYMVLPDDPNLIQKAKEKSKAFIDTMTPTVYIDEMHVDGFF
ncbi:sel1 repeat family protein [Grimontia kaedaensis]|uniref:Sel1 repeat family protein n=1 Tax=Grimontia kaedaensis TaxID=2872157 RepID=A0ABY4X3E0_9GAMM|nr:sel1 repeat family protein [Grimontia kaedaensis]